MDNQAHHIITIAFFPERGDYMELAFSNPQAKEGAVLENITIHHPPEKIGGVYVTGPVFNRACPHVASGFAKTRESIDRALAYVQGHGKDKNRIIALNNQKLVLDLLGLSDETTDKPVDLGKFQAGLRKAELKHQSIPNVMPVRTFVRLNQKPDGLHGGVI